MESPELIQALEVYNKSLDALEKAEDNVQKALGQLKRFANKSTFCVEGNYYQIRDRKGKFYLCELDGPPKGRPKKSTKSQAQEPVTAGAESDETEDQSTANGDAADEETHTAHFANEPVTQEVTISEELPVIEADLEPESTPQPVVKGSTEATA